MLTLKIHYTSHKTEKKDDPLILQDESTTYVEADRITVYGEISGKNWERDLKHWDLETYHNFLSVIYYDGDNIGEMQYANGRLITVERNGEYSWYLASRAWVLGSNGKTIERIAP